MLVEALRLSHDGAGRLDGEDDRRQVASHLLPSPLSLDAAQPVDVPQQVDETRERRARVRVERARREQQVPESCARTPPGAAISPHPTSSELGGSERAMRRGCHRSDKILDDLH